jgi:hypothetical protein
LVPESSNFSSLSAAKTQWRGNGAVAGALSSVMAVVLLSYFSTMVAALVALMLLLNTVLSSSVMQRVKPQPYPVAAMTQTAAPEQQAAVSEQQAAASEKQPGPWGPAIIHKAIDDSATVNADDLRLAAAKQAAAEKSKRLKVARNQKLNEDLAGRRQDQEYSTALGYAQDQRQPALDLFGPRRF